MISTMADGLGGEVNGGVGGQDQYRRTGANLADALKKVDAGDVFDVQVAKGDIEGGFFQQFHALGAGTRGSDLETAAA